MDRFDRINNIREQQPIPDYEMPSSQDKVAKARNYAPFPKIVAIILIAALILTIIYALLHPIDKINLKLFLFDNCTIQVVTTSFGEYEEYETKDVLIDGNLIKVGDEYYEIDGDMVYTYVKIEEDTWQRRPTDEKLTKHLEYANKLLDKNSYKKVKGKLFAWRLKNSVAETISELSSITLEKDGGKIAIMGNGYGEKISLRFTRFGKTEIDPPWEEPGMNVVE
jgi:hypothetical protein